jgi:hypothetical protein
MSLHSSDMHALRPRRWSLQCSLMAGTIAAAAVGFTATPALADVIVQQTYSVPPVAVEVPTPPVEVEAPAPTVTYTYQAPPTTYVKRTETYTYVPAPPPTREVYVETVVDTPKWDYSAHERVHTAQVQTRTTQTRTRTAPRRPAKPAHCQCQ